MTGTMAGHGAHGGARGAGEALVGFAQDRCRQLLQHAGAAGEAGEPALRLAHGVLLLRALEVRGVVRDGQLCRAAQPSECAPVLRDAFAGASQRFGAVFGLPGGQIPGTVLRDALAAYVGALCSPATTRLLRAAPIEALGQAYEQCLGLSRKGRSRKAGGVYYTPPAIVARLVDHTVGAVLTPEPGPGPEIAPESEIDPASLRVVDPACGAGAFLLGAYDRLLAAQLAYWLRAPSRARRGRVCLRGPAPALSQDERRRVLEASIFGVDLDEYALAIARLSLYLRMLDTGDSRQLERSRAPALPAQLKAGNSLVTPRMIEDRPGQPLAREARRALGWEAAFPQVSDGFDVVIGNPPWGQKTVDASDALKRLIREEYPSSRGIFDWFRPFVELGLRLTRRGGAWGMVLPDIVLLKNYEPTRRLLLDQLAMTEIEWLGMAFSGATIDAVTIAGRKREATREHRVHVVVSEPGNQHDHRIRQADFSNNPRCAFNLFLTDGVRARLEKLSTAPTLGDFFEVHEGIHSGNIRAELFVDRPLDDSCRELLFGRDELRPHVLRWAGRFVRLSALPEKRTRERYANLGRESWYQKDKILVRRTGDRITAAVDTHGRFASNNFFVVIAKREHLLSLHGLCALLNSSFITWLFRTVEPRKGRAFAEVKIKHLTALPIPASTQIAACAALNDLGVDRAGAGAERAGQLDARIDAAVLALFDLQAMPAGDPDAKARGRPPATARDRRFPGSP